MVPAHDEAVLGAETGQVDADDVLEPLEVLVVGLQDELKDAVVA